ncbi:MAG: glycosyltransferase family 4 protein, partial [Verrucomicrobiae bacterium]|nr:glycosyltransferase family 4 protein [Verrucomicrobiae bacterium]
LDRRMEVHLLCVDWAGARPMQLRLHCLNAERPLHFWENITFAKQVDEYLHKKKFDLVFSLERTLHQDVYRAGDGLHQVWIERKLEFTPGASRLAVKFNPLHWSTLELEKRTFDPERTKAIVANSLMVRKEIEARTSFPPSRVEVIPNGVDLGKFTPGEPSKQAASRRKFNLPPEKFIFLLVGSGFFRKGVPFAMDFVKKLRRPEAALWVIGRGDLPSGADKSWVYHHPKVTSISEAYKAADVFLLPTLYDPFANVVLEAMASGLPVITSGYNGAADYIKEGEEGWIWRDLRDVDGMIQRAQPLFNKEIRQSMGVCARDKAEQFSLDRNVDATVEYLKQIAGLA